MSPQDMEGTWLCPTCEGTGDCGEEDGARMTMGGPEHYTKPVHAVRVNGALVCACCEGTGYVDADSSHSAEDRCGEPDWDDEQVADDGGDDT